MGTPESHPAIRPESSRRGFSRHAVLATLTLIVAVVAIALIARRKSREAPIAATQPTSAPSTSPTTAPTQPAPPRSYMELLLSHRPDFPTTQPLPVPLQRLAEGARLIFDEPIYIDSAGELWITHPDAPPISTLLQQTAQRRKMQSAHRTRRSQPLDEVDPQSHVTRDRVVFTYTIPNAQNEPQQQIIIRKHDDTFELINEDGRIEIGTPGRKYCWDRAAWVPRRRDSSLVVPSDTGISIFRPQQRPMELYQELGKPRATTSPTTASLRRAELFAPQYLLDTVGLIAWIPWDPNDSENLGAARYVNGQWTRLDASKGWPTRIAHLVPLLDGSVIRLAADEDHVMRVSLGVLDEGAGLIDVARVNDLVAQLSDAKQETREAAHAELTRFGPAIWPTLEQLHDQQPPEGQLRIEQLLSAKLQPMLGRLVLQDGPAKVVARFADGVLLYAEAGVTMPAPNPAAPLETVAPAWISIRAGQPIQLAPRALIANLLPDRVELTGPPGEWIVHDEVEGLQRFLGNHLEPLLRKSERAEFRQFVGIDRRGRWFFRGGDDSPTLVIDPTLPDPTPSLPAWNYPVEGGTVGWTGEGWPVVKAGGAWVIGESGTRPLKRDEEMYTDLREMPDTLASIATNGPVTKPATQSSTTRSTHPSTLPTSQPGPPIGFDAQGARYYDGETNLHRIAPDGSETIWPLPPAAVGASPLPRIIEAQDRLFLFNEPGRVIRLRRTPDRTEPFAVDATFVRNIPSVEEPTRIWLDPAGRIVIAFDENRLTILFPSGRIPPQIAQRMLASDLRENEPE